jgi:1-acyl-sn-glycerol-3-phosphate acyltransferase
VNRYVRKHFRAVRLSKSGAAIPATDEPILIVLNHPSWWDPLIGIVLSRAFADREQFAAIDAVAVQKYRFFQKLGFVGVDTRSLRGAAEFLRTGCAILSQPNRVFWVTAQGRFTDVRERPLALQSGVGHLAARLERGTVLPVALEYTFWTERTPEALVRIGEPLHVAEHPGLSGKEWTALIEAALTSTLDVLNAEVMRRDPAAFTELLSGRTGVGGMYDWWRRLTAWAHGRQFDPSHEAATSSAVCEAKP